MGMANQNGAMAAGQNAAMYNPAAMNNMPAAGHYSDMQTLMQNMEALSGWLQQNREDFLRVQEDLERVERLQVLRSPNSTTENGEQEQSEADAQRPTVTSLQRELDAAKSHIEVLEHQAGEHQRLQSQYEDILTESVERTRNFTFQQNEYIISLHQHYTQLLQESRKETIDAQLTHQAWQASLAKLNDELKKAVKAREQEKDPFRRRLAMLKEENRVMREKLGWVKIVHDSDEEDEELEAGRGRPAEAQVSSAPGTGAVR